MPLKNTNRFRTSRSATEYKSCLNSTGVIIPCLEFYLKVVVGGRCCCLASYAIVFRRVALEGNTTPLKTTTWEAILLLGSKRTSLQGAFRVLLVWWGIQNLDFVAKC